MVLFPERVIDLWGKTDEFSCGQFKYEVPLRRGRAGRKPRQAE